MDRTAVHFEIVIPPLVIIFVMVFISVAESLTGVSRFSFVWEMAERKQNGNHIQLNCRAGWNNAGAS